MTANFTDQIIEAVYAMQRGGDCDRLVEFIATEALLFIDAGGHASYIEAGEGKSVERLWEYHEPAGKYPSITLKKFLRERRVPESYLLRVTIALDEHAHARGWALSKGVEPWGGG